ncbi:hypothetical protein [Streptomyces sp. NPDC059786]|uniref:hypothetical protein n=1 Tax=Streptomyces sp. NPDC059786 TaxID=3346946 RepID=UPI003666A21B
MTLFNDSIERVQDRLTVASQVLVTAYADLRVRGYDKEPSAIAAALDDMEALVKSLRAAKFGADGQPEVGRVDLIEEASDYAEHTCNCPFCLHGTAEPTADPEPEVRVFRRDGGWTMQSPGPEPCTTNFHRQQDGRPPCTAPAVWKVVEEHTSADGFPTLSIGFYCDADLPAEHRPRQGPVAGSGAPLTCH